jgi:hypothetical protein
VLERLDENGAWRTTMRGYAVPADPCIKKGTAFTLDERDALDLVGILPHRVLWLEDQVCHVYQSPGAQAHVEARPPAGPARVSGLRPLSLASRRTRPTC